MKGGSRYGTGMDTDIRTTDSEVDILIQTWEVRINESVRLLFSSDDES